MDNVQTTIEKVTEILQAGPTQSFAKDVTQASGLNAYNLEPAAKVLQPVYSPLRNMIPRVANTRGGTAVNWKVITGLDINRLDPFTAEGSKAGTVSVSASDKSAAFKTISKGDAVSFQSQWAGRSFIDNKAEAVQRLLATVMQLEERAICFGRTTALGTVNAPTAANAGSGGTIAAATYNVVVRAVTMRGTGLSSPGRGKKSTASSTTTNGSTSTISASTAWVEGAVAYEWYVGTSGGEKLEAITEVNHVKLTALAGTGAALSGVSDNADDSLAFDGLIAQLTAATGAQVTTLATGTAGAGTKLALSHLDDMFQNLWDASRVDPDVLVLNSREHRDINTLAQASTTATQVFVQAQDQRVDLAAGLAYGFYVNKTTGRKVPMLLHPFWPVGLIAALQVKLPFAIPGMSNCIEIETRQDYLQLDYPQTAPKFEFEVLVDEALKVYFPGACGVIRNIASQAVGA